MDEFWAWVYTDGLRLLGDILIPVAAILVPTAIAIRAARSERERAIEDRANERREAIADRKTELRLQAGAAVIAALVPLTSLRPDQPFQEHLWRLRSAIAVYRAWTDSTDESGDWLALRHHEGMALWRDAMDKINAYGGPQAVMIDGRWGLLDAAYGWANNATELFTGFLSGHTAMRALLEDGARILAEYPYLAGEPQPDT